MDKDKIQMGIKFSRLIGNPEVEEMFNRAALGFCPFCKEAVTDDFRDEISRKEFRISGLCQKCQDQFFGTK